MHRTLRLLIAFSLVGATIIPSTSVYAWGGWGRIRPGAHVFDAKRFMDSVRETAQHAMIYANMLDSLRNLFKKNKGSKFSDFIQRVANINPPVLGGVMGVGFNPAANTAYGANNVYGAQAIEDTKFPTLVYEDRAINNRNVIALSHHLASSAQQVQGLSSEILKQPIEGIRGEEQRSTILKALDGFEQASFFKMTSSRLLKKIQQEQLQHQLERYENDKARSWGITNVMDPYKDHEFKTVHKDEIPVKTQPLGFPDL